MLRSVTLSLVLLSAAAFAADNSALPAIPKLLEQETPKVNSVIKLHHVKAAEMAFWLDPKNHVNPAPVIDCLTGLTASPQNGVYPSPYAKSQFGAGGLITSPPRGTDSIKAVEEQNLLLVRGTKEAVEEIQQLIDLWDVPRQQVQANVTLYHVSRATLEKVEPVEKPTKAAPRVFIFKESDRKIIDAAIAEGQAKALATPKMITNNNQAACIELTNNDGEEKQTFRLSLVPTVNGDGTLTVLAQPLLQQSKPAEKDTVPVVKTQTGGIVFMVRDGDTAAIILASNENQNWLYLITPRLLKEKLAKEQIEAPLK